MTVRIHHYLADCGIASRRRSEQLISEGRVAVNGQQILRSQFIDPVQDAVTVDNHMVSLAPKIYYAFHKPVDVICSSRRQGEHPIIADCMPIFQRLHLFTVGRLDRLTSGLLLITNDGAFSRRVLLPSSQVEKEYLVRTYSRIPRETLNRFTKTRDGTKEYHIKRYRLLSRQCAVLVMTEGKNHEVRNIMKECGCGIASLIRIRVGSVMLRQLKTGRYRELTRSEHASLCRVEQGEA